MTGQRNRGYSTRMTSIRLACFFILLLAASSAGAAMECYDCHGDRTRRDIRPTDSSFRDPSSGGFSGNHQTHLEADPQPADCAICHPGSASYHSGHRDGVINLSTRMNASPATTAFRNSTTPSPQSPAPSIGACTNVNCHFEQETPSPWGSDPLQKTDTGSCAFCHGNPAEAAAENDRGNHPSSSKGKGYRHGLYFGSGWDTCVLCHPDHRKDADALAHARETGRPLQIRFSSLGRGGSYTGNVNYPDYLPSRKPSRDGTCTSVYCHSDGAGRYSPVRWNAPPLDPETPKCFLCHKGLATENNQVDCARSGGQWNELKQVCTPYVNMTSNGHNRLVGPQWIRNYDCYYCHNNTVIPTTSGSTEYIKDRSRHINGVKDIAIAPQWAIVGRDAPSYDPQTKVCNNVYCHSDGTANPEKVRDFAWTTHGTECNSCHGHPRGSCSTSDPISGTSCHDGRIDPVTGKVWTLPAPFGSSTSYRWPNGQEWKASLPMFPNQGPGSARANSHMWHMETNFTCDQCHASTVRSSYGGSCMGIGCHMPDQPLPAGSMGETEHLYASHHVNKNRDVVFKGGGSYDPITKKCSNTACHTGGTDPQWGGSRSEVICLSCHGTTGGDIDTFGFNLYSSEAKINLTEWVTTGHGRTSGPYPGSGNPPAAFPSNPCWYCHDNNVIHNDRSNLFRLRQHPQFVNRFEKECMYCHMTGTDAECISCHDKTGSLAPQLGTLPPLESATLPDGTPAPRPDHTHYGINKVSCITTDCHFVDPLNSKRDLKVHNVGAGLWTEDAKGDIRNQYIMMGVCLKCHDDDSNDKCSSCHTGDSAKYSLGFNPGTGFIKPQKARASSVHFGYKHSRAYDESGVWKGGKFCWDCHDPHGDSNIYMVQSKVATTTDGTFGVPQTRSQVVFTRKQSGLDYVRTTAPYNGICNVCHSAGSQHFRSDGGDSHNTSRLCTDCHEHRFTDSHAGAAPCSSCHQDKPVPRHSGFGLPRDCTKCHSGTVASRMDIMGQFNGTSHHVQGVDVDNRHCYACHWESTPEGLIDNTYHEGYNYRTYTSVKNAKVDLVVLKPNLRPTYYNTTTAIQFTAGKMGTAEERSETAKISEHCISCHSDQNNNYDAFGDCKTPRQYAWDGQSIASRFSDKTTTSWGKSNSTTFPNAVKKDRVTKALSAHGNAVANQGGYSPVTGWDETIPNTRSGNRNVECFDCHSSHGSKLIGVTSSYVTFNGTKNGGNLKETQAGKGGYSMTYKASSFTAPNAPNPYNAGAGQCFDCHMTQNTGTTPWGYQSTFGATAPIKGYFDSDRFGMGSNGATIRFPYKEKPRKAGHLLPSSHTSKPVDGSIDGLCTPCHDPHGVSRSLGADKEYAVPLLKGTWMTSPYKDDVATPRPSSGNYGVGALPYVYTDQNTLNGARITENDSKFGGLCLRCHTKGNLTDGTNKNTAWKSLDRVHESVKGWGANTQHSFACSKCHTPHVTSLPRLMRTNCLDYKHMGQTAASQGWPGTGGTNGTGFPSCHPDPGGWPNNYWNTKTPW